MVVSFLSKGKMLQNTIIRGAKRLIFNYKEILFPLIELVYTQLYNMDTKGERP